MVQRCVIESVLMWLHILVGPCWCVFVALFKSSLVVVHQQGPTNICSHITTDLITHHCTTIG